MLSAHTFLASNSVPDLRQQTPTLARHIQNNRYSIT